MGDIMIGRSVNDMIRKEGYDYPWGNVLPYLKNPGVNIINLETALTSSNKKVPKVFNFKADPDKVKTLSNAHIQVANIANNHILDFSEKGLLETIRLLDLAEIQHTGAGRTLAEARKPAVIYCYGLKIGIIGCTDNEPGWKSDGRPGIYYIEIGDILELKKDIESIREKVDLLILSAHFGPNMVESPDPDKIKFAHQLIDLGVDIIHGHSAHVFQGIELYKGKIIIFDAGDFIDDYVVDGELRNDRSFLFEIEIADKKIIGLRLIPVIIKNMQVNFAVAADKEWSIARMQYLSRAFGTKIKDTGEVEFC